MSNKKPEKIKMSEVKEFSGPLIGFKIAAGLCEFQLKSKKHGVQQFSFDTKDNFFFGVVVAAISGKHKISVQTAAGNGSVRSIASITIGELQKIEPKVKIEKTKKANLETAEVTA